MNQDVRRLMLSRLEKRGKQILDLYVTVPLFIESIGKTKEAVEYLLRSAEVMTKIPHNGEISFQDYDKISMRLDRALAEYQAMIQQTLNHMQAQNTKNMGELEGRVITPSAQQK